MVEQFICNDQVVGSNPTTGSIVLLYKDGAVAQRLEQGTHNRKMTFFKLSQTVVDKGFPAISSLEKTL